MDRRTFLAAAGASAVSGSLPAAGTADLLLENGVWRAAFDPDNGSLVELVSSKTGWRIQGRRNLARSFEMVVPLPERLWNVVDGRVQSPPRVTREQARLTFFWPQLRSEHGAMLDISAEAIVTLTATGLEFRMRIQNRTPLRVESVEYPCLGDLRRPDYGGKLTRANWNYGSLLTRPLYPEFANERGYWGSEFPIQMVPAPESPCTFVLADREGLYAGCHDTTAVERVEFTFRLHPGWGKAGEVPPGDEIGGQPVHTTFSAMHLPFIKPGDTYALSPIVLEPFTGDWHAGADIYRRWRDTWFHRPATPAWLQDVHSWQMLQMTTWGDSLRIPYKDLPAYVAECARHGVRGIQLVGWTLYGQDGRLPIHDIDPRLGTREELRQAIAEAARLGVRIVLYQKYTSTDVGTDWFRRDLFRYTSRDIFGNMHGHEGWRYDTPSHLAGINIRPYAWMCMNAERWQDLCVAEIERSLDLGPAGILLDESQWHGRNAYYCFAPDHGHPVPAYNFAGDEPFARKVLKLLESKGAELAFGGEGPYDLQNQFYNLTYTRTRGVHIAAQRYIDPFLPMMNWANAYDDRENLNLCLLHRYIISYEPRNFRGHLAEFPLTLEYGKKIDALRRRYREFVWDAEYRDTLGAEVTSRGGEVHYSVFHNASTRKNCIVLVNQASEPAAVSARLAAAATTSFRAASPEHPDAESSDGKVTVAPRSAVILMQS